MSPARVALHNSVNLSGSDLDKVFELWTRRSDPQIREEKTMASDYLLEIEGIKGESKDSKHPNTIEVESFSWGASNDGSAAHGSGAGTGKVHFQDVHFTTQVNKSSPELLLACANGKHIKKAQLFVRKQ